jgi:hypothetical protein
MRNIIDNMIHNEWDQIESKIRSGTIDYSMPIDLGTTLIHYLVINRRLDLIKLIPIGSSNVPGTINYLAYSVDRDGNTPIILAAKYLYLEIVDYLLEVEWQCVLRQNELGFRPIFYLLDQADYLKKIIPKYGIWDHKLASAAYGILYDFCLTLNLPMVLFLLEYGKSLAGPNAHPLDKLYTASYPPQLPLVIELAAIVKDYDKTLEILKATMSYIEDINAQDDFKINALQMAITSKQHYEFIETLLMNGIDYNYFGMYNMSHPLVLAMAHSDTKVIQLLLKYDINLDAPNGYGATPVHYIFSKKVYMSDSQWFEKLPRLELLHNVDITSHIASDIPSHIASDIPSHIASDIPFDIKTEFLRRVKSLNHFDVMKNSILHMLLLDDPDNWMKYADILKTKKLKIYSVNADKVRPIDLIPKNQLEAFYKVVAASYLNQITRNKKWISDFDIRLHADTNAYSMDEIIDRIKSGKSYPESDTEHHIKLIMSPKVNFTHYIPMTYDSIFYYVELFNTYNIMKPPMLPRHILSNPNVVSLMSIKSYNDIYKFNLDHVESLWKMESITSTKAGHMILTYISDFCNLYPELLLSSGIVWCDPKNYFVSPFFIESIKHTIKMYPDTQLIPIRLVLMNPNANYNHANMIIYDAKRKIVENFDPQQYGYVDRASGLDTFLKFFFEQNFDVKYYPSSKINPTNSFQVYDVVENKNSMTNDPIGFCLAWCIWYASMRAINHHINPKILCQLSLYKLSQIPNMNFTDYIRNYSEYITQKKISVRKQLGLPEKYLYTTNYEQIPSAILVAYIAKFRQYVNNVLK